MAKKKEIIEEFPIETYPEQTTFNTDDMTAKNEDEEDE